MMRLIEASGLGVRYGSYAAIRGVDFAMNDGEYVCVVGDNGSGKTTLVKALVGLLPYTGNVRLSIDAREVAYLPQSHPADPRFPATVWEVVLTGTQRVERRLPYYTRLDKRNALEAMERMGIDALKSARIGTLSGGQLRRALLARALCRAPKLLVLDEPAAGLDPQSTSELYQRLSSLNDSGIAILMVSHDLHEVARHATRVVEVDRGIAFDGPIGQWPHLHEDDNGSAKERSVDG